MSGPKPFLFESPILERECMRLLQIIYASERLHEAMLGYSRTTPERKFPNFRAAAGLGHLRRGEEPEASRIILNLAVVVRNSLDTEPLNPNEDVFCALLMATKEPFKEMPPEPVPEKPSEIWAAYSKENVDKKSLGIRETCNKIIHAKGVEWVRDEDVDTDGVTILGNEFPLTGELVLCGDRQKETWVCYINVETFCLATLGLY